MTHEEYTPLTPDELSQLVRAQQRQIAALTEALDAPRPGGRRSGRAGRFGISAVAALCLALVFGTVALAAIPGAGGVITGCFTKTNGALRVIDTAAGQTCTTKEVQLTWSQIGPQGPKGDTGAQGSQGIP